MMLSHPVILGLLWALVAQLPGVLPQETNKESNKVFSYVYHIQHNGTTNSKEILQNVLGAEPQFGLDAPAGRSVIKTFSSPNLRGFFSKGVLPAGPLNQNYNRGLNVRRNTDSAIQNIRKIVQDNLHPPSNIATGLLPISPDINNAFPGDFNNVNHLGGNFDDPDDFPKIPPPPPPSINSVVANINNIGANFQNQDDFPKIPPPPPPSINDNVVSRVHNFARNTPDGGQVVGKVETFAYNPPTVTNSVSNFQENAQGYRRNENFVNRNQGLSGFRTQSYFKQEYRTVTPNFDPGAFHQDNRIQTNNIGNINNNNNNQWWNSLAVFGDNRQNRALQPDVHRNIQQIQNNVENQIRNAFGARLSGFNHQVQPINNNRFVNNAGGGNYQHRNFNNNANVFNNQQNNAFRGPGPKALIDRVNDQLNNLNDVGDHRLNNARLTWDDDIQPNVNDWSNRSPQRPFSNAHSGPHGLTNTKPIDVLKSTIEALMGDRRVQIPPVQNVGPHQGNNYRNVNGGGVEKFFNVDRVEEGPNSYSRNQRRGYERDFAVNSNRGYQRSNQWSSNTVRRLDSQAPKADFNKDFIDVFNEDY